MQEYKAHDRSREAIEMALDDILKQKMKIRHKHGFKPHQNGRRTDVAGEPEVCSLLNMMCKRLSVSPAKIFLSLNTVPSREHCCRAFS